MKNNETPKGFQSIISDPSNSNELILMCTNKILRCEVIMSFETDSAKPDRARPVYDLVKT